MALKMVNNEIVGFLLYVLAERGLEDVVMRNPPVRLYNRTLLGLKTMLL